MQLPVTKFNIGESVRHRLSTSSRSMYIVQEISSITCTAGTQVFYDCRALVRNYQTENEWECVVVNPGEARLFVTRFREDELEAFNAA